MKTKSILIQLSLLIALALVTASVCVADFRFERDFGSGEHGGHGGYKPGSMEKMTQGG